MPEDLARAGLACDLSVDLCMVVTFQVCQRETKSKQKKFLSPAGGEQRTKDKHPPLFHSPKQSDCLQKGLDTLF